MSTSSIQVWVVEDQEEQRKNLVALLDEASDISCDAAYPHCEAMLEDAASGHAPSPPHVVLMDVDLLQGRRHMMSGIEGTAMLRKLMPSVATVMLTVLDDADTIFSALGAGARGYLVKPLVIDEVLNGVREAHRGGMCMSPPVARRVSAFFQRFQPPKAIHDLTTREKEILSLMERGLKQINIAQQLDLSRHTVDSHLRNIYQKLHVNSAVEAISIAIRDGQI